jgi:hypothetical protein
MAYTEQFGLLAQSHGFEDWANILFILVLAILWLLAGLIKAIGKKGPAQKSPESEGSLAQQRQRAESWQQRLARRAQELQRRLEEEAGMREASESEPPARESAPRPASAPGGKIVLRTDARGESVMVYERPQPEPPARREPQAERRRHIPVAGRRHPATPMLKPIRREMSLKAEGLLPLMAESPQPLEPRETQPATPHEPTGFEPEAIIDYTDPAALKKAILHYEILGKPIALRDTADQTSPF